MKPQYVGKSADVLASVFLAVALLLTVGIVAGVTSLYHARLVAPDVVFSNSNAALVVTATRLTRAARAPEVRHRASHTANECQQGAC